MRRTSSEQEDVENKALLKLMLLGVLELSVSPWATNNITVRKKDEDTHVTTDFQRLSDLTSPTSTE